MPSEASGCPRAGHRTLPHPADLILQAWAPTPEACVVEAVQALVDSFADTTGARGHATYVFRVPAAPWREMLVSVLEEVLFLFDAQGDVPLTTTVACAPRGDLSASFALAGVDDDVDLVGSTPKGIARSGLEFTSVDDQWRCTVIVDV